MWVVADRTILGDRRMLPEKGATLIRVTIRAQLEHGIRPQQRIGNGAVGLMTVVAIDLALEQGHVGSFSELGPFARVTSETRRMNAFLAQQSGRRSAGHGVVAITACERFRIVR